MREILCKREQRYVGAPADCHYSRKRIMLEENDLTRGSSADTSRLMPLLTAGLRCGGRGMPYPYRVFDKDQRVTHAAITENKRLGDVLAWIKERQDCQPRFNRVPDGPRRSNQKLGILKNRALQITEAAQSAQKSVRKRRRRSDTMVCAAQSAIWDISTLRDPGHLNVATQPNALQNGQTGSSRKAYPAAPTREAPVVVAGENL